MTWLLAVLCFYRKGAGKSLPVVPADVIEAMRVLERHNP